VGQGEVPEFKPQYRKKKDKNLKCTHTFSIQNKKVFCKASSKDNKSKRNFRYNFACLQTFGHQILISNLIRIFLSLCSAAAFSSSNP
jgi:hypothetical protein